MADDDMAGNTRRASAAQAKAAQAYARLLGLAEHGESGQPGRIARFLAVK